MADQPGASNGRAAELPDKKPFPRLSSFKIPRDLSLGSAAPTTKANKKVFMPNLNVVRNKNKAPTPNLRNSNKREDKKHERSNNKSKFNGPSVVKSSGVFSEGIATSERVNTRASYSRDSEPTQTNLQKPVLKVKQYSKIDKEGEDRKIKKALGQSGFQSSSDDDNDDSLGKHKDAPLRLPVSEGGSMYAKKKVQPQAKPVDVIVKKEPLDEDMTLPEPERKAFPEAAVSAFDATDVVRLLNSDKPKMILLQLPDNLPGRGTEEEPSQKKDAPEDDAKVSDNRCKLFDLEEGRIGKIQIYKSGKVKLLLGDTTFDITLGMQPCFRQDVVSVGVNDDGRTGAMINLGGINHKLNVVPDWDTLFKDVVI